MEKLKQYLKSKGLTQKAFSKRHDIPESVISRAMTGKTVPTLKYAHRIQLATKGKVKIGDWL